MAAAAAVAVAVMVAVVLMMVLMVVVVVLALVVAVGGRGPGGCGCGCGKGHHVTGQALAHQWRASCGRPGYFLQQRALHSARRQRCQATARGRSGWLSIGLQPRSAVDADGEPWAWQGCHVGMQQFTPGFFYKASIDVDGFVRVCMATRSRAMWAADLVGCGSKQRMVRCHRGQRRGVQRSGSMEKGHATLTRRRRAAVAASDLGPAKDSG